MTSKPRTSKPDPAADASLASLSRYLRLLASIKYTAQGRANFMCGATATFKATVIKAGESHED